MMTVCKRIAQAVLAAALALTMATCGQEGKDAGQTSSRLPKVMDLGATECIPCKKMAPILEGLKEELKGKAEVEFIDVWKNPEASRKYNVMMIPTQIFFDANGKEVFRHVGFFSREEILAQLKKMGVEAPDPKEPK